ncbi:MAG TPA: ABC transporter ATP-binding protein [Thermoplasmata archaeon]
MNEVADIELVDVVKRFKETLAVDNVSLSIPRGAFYSLLGPSGCGKTTTLRIIAGLETPDSGDVRLRGERVNDVPPFKRNLGMVFQGLALFPHLNVFNNVAYGLRIRRRGGSAIRRKVKQYLGLVGLAGLDQRRIAQLSGGQQQRVALARALVTEPPVILLDEPLGALDLKLRIQMQLELKRIHRQVGTTFVFVTHDQGEAMAMSGRIAVMSAGKVEQEGTPEEIYHRPKTAFVADFIGETNLLEGTAAPNAVRLPGELELPSPAELDIPEGEGVIVSVRPETIALGSAAATRQVQWRGEVEESVFRGTNALVTVRVAEGLRLVAQVHGATGAQFSLGSKIEVGFDLDSVRMFPFTRD